jgi:hypothetical protein
VVWLVLIGVLVFAGLVLGYLNRDFMDRQSRPGEEWSRDPTGNIPPVTTEFDRPRDESTRL